MYSFIGEYFCKIDSKGRVLFPSALKKQMENTFAEKFVIKKDIYENCLILYTIDEWERQNEILRTKLNTYNKEHSKLLRAYFRGTAEITLDSSNRMLLPKRLMELAGIENDIYMSGQDKKIEIWSKQAYDANMIDENEFSTLAEKLLGSNEA
ncbi:MAG: protein mraZ [Bacteroidales bacterium]|nr:protein mraZ [Bacteroidales bacterium]MBN2756842.1 protein mraZ [Bacteroidales bacterium]